MFTKIQLKDLIPEHERLIKVLRSHSRPVQIIEAEDQSKELEEYKQQYQNLKNEVPMEKNLKHIIAAAGMSLGAMSPVAHHLNTSYNQIQPKQAAPKMTGEQFGSKVAKLVEAPKPQVWDKQASLKAIAQQESGNNPNVKHHEIKPGEYAHGRYGLRDDTIKDILKRNPKTFAEHAHVSKMNNKEIGNYIKQNPHFEDSLASTYYDRITQANKTNHIRPTYISWLNGISGGQRYLQNKKAEDHPIAAKVHQYYNKFANVK